MAERILKKLLGDERGASMLEYAILVGLISAGAIALIAVLGTKVSSAFSKVNSAF